MFSFSFSFLTLLPISRSGMGVVTLEEAFYASVNLSIIVALLEATHAPFHGVGLPAYLVNVGYDSACVLTIALIVIAC